MINYISRFSMSDKPDNSNETNFEKLEQEYQAKALYNYNTFNENFLTIKAKKKEYENLLFQIQLLLEDSIQMEHEVKVQAYYNNLIKKREYDLRLMEHSLECYRNSYMRLYKTNFLLSRKVEDEVKKDITRQKQLDEYNNIKLNAIQIIQTKKAMLTRMKELNVIEEYNQQTAIKVNNHKVVQLKAKVDFLVNQIEISDKDIVMMKIKQDKIIRKIRVQSKYNIKVFKDNKGIKKDYIRGLYLLYTICNQMKVKNEDLMIEKFNSIKLKANKQLATFEILNKYIRQSSTEYYDLTEDINQLSHKIELKEKNELLLDEQIDNAKNKLITINCYLQSQQLEINKKKEVFLGMMEFIIKYYNSLTKLNPKPHKLMSKIDSSTCNNWSYCLTSFCKFVELFSKLMSQTLKKAIESYFIYRLKHTKKFKCIGYSNEKFISDYKEFVHKTTEQYFKMILILNKSLRNYNDNKDKPKEQDKEKDKEKSREKETTQLRNSIVNLNLMTHLQLVPVRSNFKKRSNIFELTQQYDNKTNNDFKINYIKTDETEEKKIAYPEMTIDKENEEIHYQYKTNMKFKKKRKTFSYSFGSEEELYLRRSTDIRKLKLNYFHLKEKQPIKPQSIFELCYKLKKQFKTAKKCQFPKTTLHKRNFSIDDKFPILSTKSDKTHPKIVDIIYHNSSKEKSYRKHKTEGLFLLNNI